LCLRLEKTLRRDNIHGDPSVADPIRRTGPTSSFGLVFQRYSFLTLSVPTNFNRYSNRFQWLVSRERLEQRKFKGVGDRISDEHRQVSRYVLAERKMKNFKVIAQLSLLVCSTCLLAQEKGPADPQLQHRIAERQTELNKLKGRDPEPSIWNQYLEEQALRSKSFTDEIQSQPELPNKFEQSVTVAIRRERIRTLSREIHELNQPYYQENLKRGQVLLEERHRALGSSPIPSVPQLQRMSFDVLSFPKIDGSTSTQPLASLIACRHYDLDYRWVSKLNSLSFGSNLDRIFDQDVELTLAEYTIGPAERTSSQGRLAGIVGQFLIANQSTHQAYVNIIEGASGIGLLARKPSPEELELARSKNVELDVFPCARDAFVFAGHERCCNARYDIKRACWQPHEFGISKSHSQQERHRIFRSLL
jgi:hypothetical protein